MIKKINNFLKTIKKILKKKKWFINTSKQKKCINKLDLKMVIINTLDNFKKENLPILILQTKLSIPTNK